MPIMEKEDSAITPEAYLEFQETKERALTFSDIREAWKLDWMSTDLYLIIDKPCLTKDCIRKKIEYYKDEYQLEAYTYMVKQAEAMAWNRFAMPTALHQFYELLIDDLITVVEAFNTEFEIQKWYEVKEEYMEKYRDYHAEALEDPLGFGIKETITPIIKVGTDIISDITVATTEGVASSIFGKDWKTKAIIFLVVAGIVVVLGLILYSFTKSYIQEKGRKSA